MIAKLKGVIDEIGPDGLVVDVAGVGYQVFASSRTLSGLAGAGQPVELQIDTPMREDHSHLYGFTSGRERQLFRMLQSVQGVGARLALAILSVLEPDYLESAIAAQDKAAFSPVPGVGPKLAQRIVSELKDKVGILPMPAGRAAAAGSPEAGGTLADAVSALVNLGYRPVEAQGAVMTAANDLGTQAALDDLIRGGLKELAR